MHPDDTQRGEHGSLADVVLLSWVVGSEVELDFGAPAPVVEKVGALVLTKSSLPLSLSAITSIARCDPLDSLVLSPADLGLVRRGCPT